MVGDGLVLTNAHNLRGVTTLVTFADGRSLQSRAQGVDVDSDLVVLSVDTGTAPALEWADGDVELGAPRVRRGQHPRRPSGDGRHRVGHRSVLRGPRGRLIPGGIEHAPGRAARPGSSTPTAACSASRRCGSRTASRSPSPRIDARERVDALTAGREPRRRLLGIGAAPAHVARRMRQAVGLPERDGVLVRAVESDSPAEQAGLRQGDLITTAAGTDIAHVGALAAVLDGLADGQTLALHVVRGTEELDVVARFDDAEDTAGDVGDA